MTREDAIAAVIEAARMIPQPDAMSLGMWSRDVFENLAAALQALDATPHMDDDDDGRPRYFFGD